MDIFCFIFMKTYFKHFTFLSKFIMSLIYDETFIFSFKILGFITEF